MYLKCSVCGFAFGVFSTVDLAAEEKQEIMRCPCGAMCEEVEELHANVLKPKEE